MDLPNHLRHAEQRLLDPAIRADAAELTHLLAPDFQEFGSSGRIYTRDQIIAALAQEPLTRTPPVLTDFALLASTDTWALVTYRIIRHDLAGNLLAASLRSSTWVLRDGRWQMLFHQGTPQPLPPTTVASPV